MIETLQTTSPIIELCQEIAAIIKIVTKGNDALFVGSLEDVGINNKKQLHELHVKIQHATGVIVPLGKLAGGTDEKPDYTKTIPEIAAYIKDVEKLEKLRQQVKALEEKIK